MPPACQKRTSLEPTRDSTCFRTDSACRGGAAARYVPEQVAAALGRSAWWVKDRARRRLNPSTRVGRAYRFSDEHLAEIIPMHEERPAQRSQRPGVVPVPTRKPRGRQ